MPWDAVNFFCVNGIDKELHSDDKCKVLTLAAMKTGRWQDLPQGPLRKAFEDTTITPEVEE